VGSPVAVDGKIPAPAPGVRDAYLAPPPPYKATGGVPGRNSTVRVLIATDEPPVPPKTHNVYWQELEKRLGVIWDATLVPTSAYDERLAAQAAANDLPDLVLIDPEEQAKLIQQRAFADLSPFLSGDARSEFPNLAAFPPQTWQNITLNRRIYGVPRPRPLVGAGLFYRKDWATKLGNPEPKAADELYRLLADFTESDPDGNGNRDTYGVGRFATLVAHNMFRVPNQWRKEADGRMTHYITVPEYREAITFARRLYEGGANHPDALTLTAQQERDALFAGKIGALSDSVASWPGTSGLPARVKRVTPTADLQILVPPGHNGGKGVHWLSAGYNSMAAMAAQAGRDPERVRELLRVLDYIAAPFGSEEFNFVNYGLAGVHHTPQPDGMIKLTEQGEREIRPGATLTRIGNAQRVLYYPGALEDARVAQEYERRMLEIGVADPSLGAYSPTRAAKSGELEQFISDETNSIIVGRKPLGALDEMIAGWKSRGGDQMARELAESLKE
jgi:putative aldouronate transport system substrate-binding protein